jgi:hypothetical protein
MSCNSLGAIEVNYTQAGARNIVQSLFNSPPVTNQITFSNIRNWSNISSGTGPSATLPICVSRQCPNNNRSVNVQKIINSAEPVYACISNAKTEKNASGNNIHVCNDGVLLSELPFSNTLPSAFNDVKNKMCVSLPVMSLAKSTFLAGQYVPTSGSGSGSGSSSGSSSGGAGFTG